ncbi:hypothetical protein PHISCL_08226 [Aspergillus sclerotialis]|uniref:Uncharacterized protein n=1 Tax=Aspergillus sclerotialis TaxID=2070753 RepID=A0A3A2ZDP1_9EURO|nr:hypothetical protein PHISCL_08226 [Aspergillus sclerotialis]
MEVSNEVKTKRRRRKHRGRKKKGTATVESINPGRAPLGFHRSLPGSSHLLQHDNQSVATHTSDCTETSARIAYLPVRSPKLPWTPVPPPPPSTPVPIPERFINFLKKLTSEYPDITERDFLPFQKLKVIAELSSPTPSTLHLDSVQKGEEHCAPPSPVKRRRGLVAMAGQRLPFTGKERRMMAPEIPKVTITAATDGLDDLPPSRPIPLSALSSRASSRNKGAKPWKPFQFSEIENEDTNDLPSNRNLSESSQYDPRTHLPALYQPNSSASSLRLHQRDSIPLSQYYQQEQTLEDRSNTMEQGWARGAGADISRNPLSYSSGNGAAFESPYPHHQAYNAEGPFPGNENCLYVEYPTGFTNQFAVPAGRPSPSGVQSSYVQNFVGEGHAMPEPHYLYPGYQQYMSSSYRWSSHEHQPPSQMIARLSAPILQSASSYPEVLHENHNAHRRLKTDGMYPNVNERLFNLTGPAAPTNPAAQLQRPNLACVPTSNSGRHSKAIEIKPPQTSPDPSKTVKKAQSTEEIKAYLKNFVRESIAAEEKKVNETALRDPSVNTENLSGKECHKGAQKAPGKTSFEVVDEKNAQESQKSEKDSESEKKLEFTKEPQSEKKPPIPHKILTAREEFRLLCASSDPEPWSPKPPVEDQIQDSWFQGPTVKQLGPPPGLLNRIASERRRLSPIGSQFSRQRAILKEANNWFHTDNRGDEELRQQVAEVAQSHADNLAKSKGLSNPNEDPEIENSKQMTLLLGNAILNLKLYRTGDRDAQASNFANFGPAPPHCYEPSHGGRRSYFDRDPFVDTWRPLTSQAIPTSGGEEEKGSVSSGLQESSKTTPAPGSEVEDAKMEV